MSAQGTNWIEVDEGALAHNFGAIQAQAGPATEVLAVVKANGYGHGAERCAVGLARAGAKWLGVTGAAEGARVRAALAAEGLEAEILVMCGMLAGDVGSVREARLTPVVWTAEQVGWLAGTGCGVHVEVDTGMGRQGVRVGAELGDLLTKIRGAGLRLDAVFTHFCSAEEAGSELTRAQETRFAEAVAQVRAAGFQPRWVHAGNSSTVDNPLDGGADGRDPWLERLAKGAGARAMVRTGIGLYGYCLPVEGCAEARGRLRPELRPVMTWKARVLAVRELAEGETVGYNATFRAERAMRVALLGVGYANGLRRELSSRGQETRGWVTIAGKRAAILGRVSMNLTVVDVTEIDGVRAGDEAVVLGEGVTADDHARLAGTIAYEIVCGVRPGG